MDILIALSVISIGVAIFQPKIKGFIDEKLDYGVFVSDTCKTIVHRDTGGETVFRLVTLS